jgi:hypothetical protein
MLSQSPKLDSVSAIHSRRNGLIDNTLEFRPPLSCPRGSAAPVLVMLVSVSALRGSGGAG